VTLSEMIVDGIKTNVPLQQPIMANIGFKQGGANIHYLEKRLAERKEKAIGIGERSVAFQKLQINWAPNSAPNLFSGSLENGELRLT
jgi:hypothetical protein